jgi:hypothetical protein
VELLLVGAERPNPQAVGQLDARQVVDVLAVALELLGLGGRPAEQRRADAGALDQQRDGRAERAGPDDDGASRVLAGIAEGRAQVFW